MSSARLIIGDTRRALRTLDDGSVDAVVTSPPFLGLRAYLPDDHEHKGDELGTEPDPATFVDALLDVTAELGRVLSPNGSIFVELGDSYCGGRSHGSDDKTRTDRYPHGRGQSSDELVVKTGPGWPDPKSLALVPELYRLALRYGVNPLTGDASPAGRWHVGNVVRWYRPNPVVGELFDKLRPATSEAVWAWPHDRRPYWLGDGSDLWTIATTPYRGAHFAVWPAELAARAISSLCPAGGVVLDPFAGSGTTLAVAAGHGLDSIGIDIDDRNVELVRERVGLFLSVVEGVSS